MNKTAALPAKKPEHKRRYLPDLSGPIQPAPSGIRNTTPEQVTRAVEAIFRLRLAAAQA